MANPQKEDGHIEIANELWGAISRTRLNGSECSCLDLIFRLSYGCQKNAKNGEEALIDKLSDFEVVGVKKQNVKAVLKSLTEKNIIRVGRVRREDECIKIRFNKNYDRWNVQMAPRLVRYKQLINLNLTSNENITGGNRDITESNENITTEGDEVMRILPSSNKFITSTASKSNDNAASQRSKDSIKDNKNKEENSISSDYSLQGSCHSSLVSLINEKCGTMWIPTSDGHRQSLIEFRQYDNSMIAEAFDRALHSKPGIKPPVDFNYVLGVLRNMRREQESIPKQPQGKTPREKMGLLQQQYREIMNDPKADKDDAWVKELLQNNFDKQEALKEVIANEHADGNS